jgi:acyl transferase domain-containing protein
VTSLRDRIESLSPRRLALLAHELDEKLREIERQRPEPIAVVGIGCRIPGCAPGPQAFWSLLANGRDAVCEVPADRWDIDQYYDPDPDAPARISTRWGGFLEGPVGAFDALFFGISGREAVSMDPQHRLLLEVAWEAIEHSGHDPHALAGSRTGVYIGISTTDYHHLLLTRGQHAIDAYTASGSAHSIAAARISYVLDLRGPNLAIDTSCSSSLVSVHMACQGLLNGDCTMALAGGVNLLLSPEVSIALSRSHMMAGDGRSKAFDERADGFVRGEGCAIVVLKRLSDAQADGDNVLALISGSAVNQDGRSNGITAPSGPAQESVIRAALASARVAPEEIDYVEAHGTGTALGDPIEAHALAAVMGGHRSVPLLVGSVKANLGHLEAAAGVAGLIKVVLALNHGAIPPQLHFRRLNPHIDWSGASIEVAVSGREWSHGDRPRRAGVSSFGFSGTNAHVVVEEAPEPAPRTGTPRSVHVLPLSARTSAALDDLTRRYAGHDPAADLGDLCYTAAVGRAHFAERAAYVATNADELAAKLCDGRASVVRSSPIVGSAKIAFLFSGQGSHYPQMGRQLYDTEPVFRQAIDDCKAYDLLYGSAADQLDQTHSTQPALFALEYALATLWQHWGVVPNVLLGHSVGEYAAACVAGVFSLAQGLELVSTRGRLMSQLPSAGGMAAIMAPEPSVRARLTNGVSIAAINGPMETVVSGPTAEVESICAAFQDAGARVERLSVSHAFHSRLMEPIADSFAQLAATMDFQAPRLRLISSVTGRRAMLEELSTASYWRRQVRDPVQFHEALKQLAGCEVVVEIGPGSTLLALGRAAIGEQGRLWTPSIRRSRPDTWQMAQSLAELYVRGVEVDWVGYHQGRGSRRIALPTYPFQRQRYWIDGRPAPDVEPETAPSLKLIGSVDVFNKDGSVASRAEGAVPCDLKVKPTRGPALEDWFYQVTWHPAELGAPAKPAVWVLFSVEDSFCLELAVKIRESGLQCYVVQPGAPLPERISAGLPVRAVYAGALTAATLEASRAACAAVIRVVRELGPLPDARLHVLTCGAQPVGPVTESAIWQAPLWGLGRTVAVEHAEIWGGLFDLDPADVPAVAAEQLWRSLTHPPREDQVAFRSGRLMVARLERVSVPPCASPTLQPDGSYLVTGGFRGLGLEVAHWLVRCGARRLILVARTVVPPRDRWSDLTPASLQGRVAAAVRELEGAGAEVHTVSLDVGDEKAVRAFLATWERERRMPIRGVVHAAGLEQQAPIADTTEADLETLFHPKFGGWVLHRALAGAPLDFFVLFSSASALLGAPRHGAYAAANALLDGLAAARQSSGFPALSVNWGVWKEAGMATRFDPGDVQAYSDRGMRSMSTAEGLEALGRLLGGTGSGVAVLPIDWAKWANAYPALTSSPFLSCLVAPAKPATGCAQLVLDGIFGVSPRDRRNAIETYFLDLLATVSGFAVADIDIRRPVTELGLDSLMALETKNRVHAQTGVSLPIGCFLEGKTIEQLAAELEATLTEHRTPQITDRELLARVDELSEADLDLALVRLLADST